MRLEMNSKDFEELERAFRRLPGEIRTKAMRRAMTRVAQIATFPSSRCCSAIKSFVWACSP